MIEKNAKVVLSKLKSNKSGLTITELSEKCKLTRTTVRTALALLQGQDKVTLRRIGMAKVYTLK